jgi:hypothetical protein
VTPVAIDPVTAERSAGALAVPERAAVAVAGPRRRRLPVLPLGIIGLFVLVAILAPLLSPANPLDQSLRNRFKPPVWMEGGSTRICLARIGWAATSSRASSGARASR